MPSSIYKPTYKPKTDLVKARMLLLIFFVLVVVCALYQIQIITLQPHYFFVFAAGNLFLSAYLFFVGSPRQEYYVPIHLFLWMFLFDASHEPMFFCAGLLFVASAIYYLTRTALQTLAKRIICAVMLGSVIAAVVLDPALLFIACTLYLIVMVLHSSTLHKSYKWNIAVVGLLHALAIAACSAALYLPYQENTIFTLPTSFFLYVFIVLRDKMTNSLYKLLFAPSILFMSAAIVLFGYSIASFQLVVLGVNRFHHFMSASLALGGITLLLCLYIQRVIASRYENVKRQLDDWFRQKFEDAWSQHDREFSWSGLDSILGGIVPNDGIQIFYYKETVFSSGCFRDKKSPVGKRLSSGGGTELAVHETNTHMPFSASQYYALYALATYIDEKLGQWQEISTLKAHRLEGGGDLGRDLKFRQEVTYYLHDNILQNIIAAKNMMESVTTEQAALKELAVGTLAELNSSIRSQMHDIYPSTLADLSFERNIHILIDEMRKRYGYIPTPHIAYEIPDKLDEQSAYLFYRTIQELLANTCKYGEADNVWIHLYAEDSWVLELREDGKRIAPEDLESKIKHLGIGSLKQQARSLDGEFAVMLNEQDKTFKLTLPRRTP